MLLQPEHSTNSRAQWLERRGFVLSEAPVEGGRFHQTRLGSEIPHKSPFLIQRTAPLNGQGIE